MYGSCPATTILDFGDLQIFLNNSFTEVVACDVHKECWDMGYLGRRRRCLVPLPREI